MRELNRTDKLKELLKKLYWYHEYQSNHYALPKNEEYHQKLTAEIADVLGW